MNQSFLILGNSPSLAFAEIYQSVGADGVIAHSPSAVVVKDNKIGKIAPVVFGGVPKSGIIIDEMVDVDPPKIASILQKHIKEGQKFHFGLSSYVLDSKESISQQKLKAIGLEIKKILKQSKASVRLVESKSGNLSSVDVAKNKLLDKGVELCLLITKDNILIGKTEAVQPFEEYSQRDYGRPSRDMKRGMLPPKVAKAMINLSKVESDGLILDPFCGVGTVLQEAMLLGYKVIGTDIDEKAIKQTKDNIEWLLKQNKKELPEYKIDTMDVRKLDETITEKSVDAIVTEFDLGPPLQADTSETKVDSIERSLSGFYEEALGLLLYVLKDESRAVVAWPHFTKHNISLSVFDKLLDLGWEVVAPFPEEYEDTYSLSDRKTLLYGRDDQNVFREIIILEKK